MARGGKNVGFSGHLSRFITSNPSPLPQKDFDGEKKKIWFGSNANVARLTSPEDYAGKIEAHTLLLSPFILVLLALVAHIRDPSIDSSVIYSAASLLPCTPIPNLCSAATRASFHISLHVSYLRAVALPHHSYLPHLTSIFLLPVIKNQIPFFLTQKAAS